MSDATACWVCGATGNPLHERIGGMRCVESGPCEARQPAHLARLHSRGTSDVPSMCISNAMQNKATPNARVAPPRWLLQELEPCTMCATPTHAAAWDDKRRAVPVCSIPCVEKLFRSWKYLDSLPDSDRPSQAWACATCNRPLSVLDDVIWHDEKRGRHCDECHARPSQAPICSHCKRAPATCLGQYDNMPDEQHACDACCGHGNEDGWCNPIAKVADSSGQARHGFEACVDWLTSWLEDSPGVVMAKSDVEELAEFVVDRLDEERHDTIEACAAECEAFLDLHKNAEGLKLWPVRECVSRIRALLKGSAT